jgi:hypothetical protein
MGMILNLEFGFEAVLAGEDSWPCGWDEEDNYMEE